MRGVTQGTATLPAGLLWHSTASVPREVGNYAAEHGYRCR